MSKIRVIASIAGALGAAGLWAATVNAEPAVLLKPSNGLSLDIGSKRAVGHFENRDGKCNLTLLIAETGDPADAGQRSAARLRLDVEPGKAAHIDTAEGKSVAFACALGATAMTVKSVDHVAWLPRS